MCEGVEVIKAGKLAKVNFVSPVALAPVLVEGACTEEWIHWGRRKKEPGTTPIGGWARATTIQLGDWDSLEPVTGWILAERFNQAVGGSNLQGRRLSKWHDIPNGSGIRCIVVGAGDQRCFYVVTTTTPREYTGIPGRWPIVESIGRRGAVAALE